MRETLELRVVEDFAPRLFHAEEGKKLGSGGIRLIRIPSNDPRLFKIGQLQADIVSELGRSFFHGWIIHRQYPNEELNAAEALKLDITHTFEPTGEECGTVYDELNACPQCGAGATQTSVLRLDLRKAPKKKDIARTIAGEVIVSQRLAELFMDADLKGLELRQVKHKAKYEDDPIDMKDVPSGRNLLQMADAAGAPHPTVAFWVWLNRAENGELLEQVRQEYAALKHQSALLSKPLPVWYQLIASPQVAIVAPTRVGIDPFDDDPKGEYRCPRGDTIGLNLLSEVSISQKEFATCDCDLLATRQYVGVRRGLLRPEQLSVISPKLHKILSENDIKGYRVEVVHLK